MLWFRSKISNWQRAKTLSTATRQPSNAWRREPKCKSNRWKTRLVLLICGLQVFRCAYHFLCSCPRDCCRLTFCRKRLKSTRRKDVLCSRSWKPESSSCRGSSLTRDAWSSGWTVWSETHDSSGRKNVWVTTHTTGLNEAVFTLDFRFPSLPLQSCSRYAFFPAGKKSERCRPGDAKETQAERWVVKPAQGCCDGQWDWFRTSTTSEAKTGAKARGSGNSSWTEIGLFHTSSCMFCWQCTTFVTDFY